MFKALLIEDTTGTPTTRLADLDDEQLPAGSVTVDVTHSSLNYKDALAITGSAPIARSFPMVPGIDLAGTVLASDSAEHATGDQVLATGHGLGEKHWGGLAQRARLDGDWLLPLPEGMSAQQTMAIGTAGFTAMLCVLALEDNDVNGEVLVTGANGGVGSIAVSLLAALGHTVIASTGRLESADQLRALGAAEVIDRAELAEPGKPLAKTRWGGVIDTVGSHTLANACASTKPGGVVTACGNAGGMDFPATVAPFILRGVTLVGIESAYVARERRLHAWQRLGQILDLGVLDSLTTEVGLAQALEAADQLLRGRIRGRLVVNTQASNTP